jgi:hypothetical protein
MKNPRLRTTFIVTAIVAIITAVTYSCSKTDDKGNFYMKLTDSPGDYQEVNVDIKGAQVYSDKKGWVDLDVKAGVYNLLQLTNGNKVLIASGAVATGNVSQVRLILGEHNTVRIADQVYVLETPSSQQSGLKLNIHDEIMPNASYTLILDFDASKSVVKTGNERYILKPVIRAIPEPLNAAIKGQLQPASLRAAVFAVHGADTFSAYTSATTGEFMIQGLYPGTFDVTVVPTFPAGSASFSSVLVKAGQVTDMGVIVLR